MKKLRLNKDLDELIISCLNFDSTIEAIILYGGYGRGEGAWIEKQTEFLCPYNDYDLLVVSDNKPNKIELKLLRESLAKRLDISWVDISYITSKRLKKLKPSIFNYDLIHGSTLIYGDVKILETFPDIKSNAITLKETRILFFTRMFTLIGCCDSNAFSIGIEAGEGARFFRSQIAKCIFAGVDAMLISEQKYESSYKKRIDKIKLSTQETSIHKLFDFAIENKLGPSDESISQEKLESIYNNAFDFYCETMFASLAKYYGINDIDFDSIRKKYISETTILARRAFHFLTMSDYFEKALQSDLIQLAYIFASPNSLNDKNAQKYLSAQLSLGGPYTPSNHEIVRKQAVAMRLGL